MTAGAVGQNGALIRPARISVDIEEGNSAMADDNRCPSTWEKANVFASWTGAISSVATTCLAALSVWFLFTQTPLFEGTRPRLSYFVVRSNSVEKDADGLMASTVAITVQNKSRYPAKDVYVVVGSLGKTGWSIDSQYHAEELTRPGDGPRIILLKTVPANSEATVRCVERVAEFPEGIESWRGMFGGDDELDREAGKLHIRYAGLVSKVYTDFGDVVQLDHLNRDQFKFLDEDYRSERGQKRKAELQKERFQKEGFKFRF